MKRKRSSTVVTLTNSIGEVVRTFSTGSVTRKIKAGRKIRKAYFYFIELMAEFTLWYREYRVKNDLRLRRSGETD
jgi:hypothetical protein